ncbi:MBL fold metallo-hydrolase [Candidatus Berkelbacteria bacterium]|nr:MBL fold metallo-hydrolase [Candidatus Berkelbacteria bacterium]
MVISSKGANQFEIKTKFSTIAAGERVTVNSTQLAGPGEYEVGDCKVTGFPPSIYRIEAEELTIVYLDGIKEKPSDAMIEELSEPDALFIPVGGGIGSEDAEKLIKLIDPKVVIPIGSDDDLAKLGGTLQPTKQLKLTKQTLPETGRVMYQFT